MKKFKPRKGQIDFTNIRWTPVINCVLEYKNKILVVQRSKNLHFYPGYWSGISGFLDDQKNLEQKIWQELKEEAGLSKNYITSIKPGQIFDQDDSKYKKTWIVHPVLVEVDTDRVTIDWESKKYQWVKPRDVTKLNLLPGFDQVLKALKLIK